MSGLQSFPIVLKSVIGKQEAEECDATNVERSDKAGYINKKRRPYGVGAVTQ